MESGLTRSPSCALLLLVSLFGTLACISCADAGSLRFDEHALLNTWTREPSKVLEDFKRLRRTSALLKRQLRQCRAGARTRRRTRQPEPCASATVSMGPSGSALQSRAEVEAGTSVTVMLREHNGQHELELVPAAVSRRNISAARTTIILQEMGTYDLQLRDQETETVCKLKSELQVVCPHGSTGTGGVCQPCEQNTERHDGAPGASKAECLCMKGFFQPDAEPGGACVPCLDGAVCAGARFAAGSSYPELAQPEPEANFWAQVRHGSSNQSSRVILGTRERIGNDGVSSEYFGMFECDPPDGRCTGNIHEPCGAPYAGALCTQCSADHFAFFGNCLGCPANQVLNVVSTIFLVCLLIFLWVSINTIIVKHCISFDLFLSYCQIASLVGGMNVPWDFGGQVGRVLSHMFSALGIADFDVDVISINCVANWDFRSDFALQLLIPVFLVAVRCVRHTLRSFGCERLGGRGDVTERLQLTTSTLLGYLSELYLTVSRYSLVVFVCTQLPDGTYMLDVHPDTQCWDSTEHQVCTYF